MPVFAVVQRNSYRDSVSLMELAASLQRLPSVEVAAVLMGTPANHALFAEAGLLTPEIETAGPGDLCIALRAADREAAEQALARVDELLGDQARQADRGAQGATARSLEGGLALLPQANVALISVPGPYAAAEARKALDRDLHVFLFSDNVPLENEVALKGEAERRGLLMMGPDCGTAIVGGVALGFANQVPSGPVGLVGSSGTGLQEVSSLLAHLGSGITHALGTGTHDLSSAVGGITTRMALRALMADSATRVLVWISKPGDPTVTRSLLEEFAHPPKPLVAMLLGLDSRVDLQARYPDILFAATLEEAALNAGPGGSAWQDLGSSQDFSDAYLTSRVAALRPEQRELRGIFAGGTLAAEAAQLLSPVLGAHDPSIAPPGALLASGASHLVDYGDDAYTRGRAHPMIDPRVRQEAIRAAGDDGGVAVVLFDVILGYGSHEDPAGALVPALEAASSAARGRGGDLIFVAHLCGTDQDPQPYGDQEEKLKRAGVLVSPSNAGAARLAATILQKARSL